MAALLGVGLVPVAAAGGAVVQVGVVSVSGGSAAEGEPVRFWVGVSPVVSSDVVVELTAGVDRRQGAVGASPGPDFRAVSDARVVIHAGSAGTWLRVPTLEDGLFEGDETFVVRAVDVVEGLARVSSADRAVGTIVDDDAMPQVGLHQAAAGGNDAELTLEGGSADEPAEMVFRVGLSSVSGVAVTVPFTVGGTATAGVDYVDPVPKEVVIAAGEVSGVIAIETLPDVTGEDHETVVVTLGTPVPCQGS